MFNAQRGAFVVALALFLTASCRTPTADDIGPRHGDDDPLEPAYLAWLEASQTFSDTREELRAVAPGELAILDAAEAVEAAAERHRAGLVWHGEDRPDFLDMLDGRAEIETPRAPRRNTKEQWDAADLALDVAERATAAAERRVEEAAPTEWANYLAARGALRAANRLLDVMELEPLDNP